MLYKKSRVLLNEESLKSLGFENYIYGFPEYYYYTISRTAYILFNENILSFYLGNLLQSHHIKDANSFISIFNGEIDFYVEHFGLKRLMDLLEFQPIGEDEYRKYSSEYIYIFNNHNVLERSPMNNIMHTDYIPIKGDWKKLLDEICLIKK